jgi:hypothetical protein
MYLQTRGCVPASSHVWSFCCDLELWTEGMPANLENMGALPSAIVGAKRLTE